MVRDLFKGLFFITMLSMAGCGEHVELHRELSEQEANEVIAELANKQINAQKIPAKSGVSVRIRASDISRAVNVLEAAGLPRAQRTNLGDIFRKEGVISTPWKNVRAISMRFHKSSRPRCQRLTASLWLACMSCCLSE